MGSKSVWMKLVLMFILLENCLSEGCWEEERLALLKIKHFFNDNFSHPGRVWGDENLDCCQWRTVQCNRTTGRVIRLDLSFIRYFWQPRDWNLNASLFSPFQELEWLDLSLNDIAGCVENEGFNKLSTLSNLKTLDLSDNGFNNSILSSLDGLSSLKILYLNGNRLSGTIDVKELDSLSNLEKLDMSWNVIDRFVAPKDYKGLRTLNTLCLNGLRQRNFNVNTLLQSLGSFPSLKQLDLGNTVFYEEMITQELPNLTNLEVLILDRSSLRISLLQKLATFTSLKRLSMVDCTLLPGISNPQDILTFKNLKYLSMDGTKLDVDGFLQISKSMASLKFLSLSNCRLKGTILDQGFCEMASLDTLLIHHNDLDGILPQCFANLTSLQLLDLSFNQISGNISSSPLRYLTSIQHLVLSNNRFQIPISLEPFYNHSKLKSFYGDINQIYEDTETYSLAPKFQLNLIILSGYGNGGPFPKFLYHQHDLQEVDLSHINLRGGFPYWLLENNTKLETLSLINNSLSGSIRMPIHPAHNLRSINVSRNFFHGHIPVEIGTYLPGLIYFNISKNALNGSIPSSFGDMNLLENLDLSNNQLSGGIPEHLALGCFSLKFLVLSNNCLQGHIFSRNFNLTKLFRLQLDDNHFIGKIPNSLSNCSSLAGLYLSNNHFSGTIPNWLGSMSTLLDIIIPNNHLEGPIPTEFCRLDNLEVLDLSNNNITGSLPSCFSPFFIKQVHLSKNRLEGQLKDAFRDCSLLLTLDLSYNHLNGSIPDWIDHLSRLSYLILGNNNLEGEVPIQLCRLKQLQLLDLSHNNLSGQLPPCLDNTALREIYDDDAAPTSSSIGVAPMGSAAFPPDNHPMGKAETIPFTTKNIPYYYQGKILTNMSGIDLSCNQLTGEIPSQIGYLTRIHALNLSHNCLTGTNPETFKNLKQIESLDLSHNNLQGKIPSELVELNTLAVFSVAHNNLSGKTPDRTAQFITFNESSYEGNPFLCGMPLSQSCNESTPSIPKASTSMEEDSNLIDMDNFYITFIASYIVTLLGVTIILYVNSYWRHRWFYFVEKWMTFCYYFIVDHLSPKRFCH